MAKASETSRDALAQILAESMAGWSSDTSEPLRPGWSEALRQASEAHNERVNASCLAAGYGYADVILKHFTVEPLGEELP